MFARFSQSVEIWRTTTDQMDNMDESTYGDEIVVPGILFGKKLSHVIDGCVIAPRTTEIDKSSNFHQEATYTGKTMYCEIDADIKSNDYVVYEDFNGVTQVFFVEGESNNDYVSPFTSYMGGKEVFLGRVGLRRVEKNT